MSEWLEELRVQIQDCPDKHIQFIMSTDDGDGLVEPIDVKFEDDIIKVTLA